MEIRTVAPRLVVALATFACSIASPVPATAAGLPASIANTDRGGHYWFRFCEGQPDATPLPADPRSLVTPTSDKAVVFNVSWFSCLNQQPATCGELRALRDAGGRLLQGNGEQGAAHPSASGLR